MLSGIDCMIETVWPLNITKKDAKDEFTGTQNKKGFEEIN